MASVDGDSATMLASQFATPIAQLNPDLPDQATRAVRGEITITWPYNSVTKTLAFLLAEPDVRLRRAKGQIRIALQGPSATVAFESGLGAGDELLFSLDGATWSKDVSPGRIPGARVEWQLQFNQRLVLQVKSGESGEVKHINIDHPTPEQPDGPVAVAPRVVTPEPEPSILEPQSAVRKISEFSTNEYPSPAFVKRARISYGALFEGGFDIFEEDGGVKGRGRKRTRFGRDSSAWRYSSQSPSPEPTSPVPNAMDEDTLEEMAPQPSPKQHMVDDGCQTTEVEMDQAAPELGGEAAAQGGTSPALPETPVPAPRESPTSPAQEEQTANHQIKRVSASFPPPREERARVDHKEQISAPQEQFGLPPQTDAIEVLQEEPVQKPAQEHSQEHAQEQLAEVRQPTPPPIKNTGPVPSPTTLFGPKSFGSSFSSFGTGAPARVESALSLADQVRFGFSHIPQTTHAPSAPQPEPAPEPDIHKQDPYPVSYLDNVTTPAKYADMNTYLKMTDEQEEMAVPGQTMPPEPPAVERFGEGQWEMSTQSPHYNPVEGGHFGTDALDEGTRVIAGQPSLHADNVVPDKVPEGFASYGHEDVPDRRQESPPHQTPLQQAPPHEDQPLVENEDTISGDEVGVEEEEDADAEFDEVAYGERIEEGDYDQRNYDIPSDDEEGLSEEDDETELEAEERYGNGEAYDEDGEGEEWDEDEDLESDEEDYEEEEDDMRGYQPQRPAAPVPAGKPVVISLLSDSEDEDEPTPAPAPSRPRAAARAVRVPEPPTSPKEASSPRRSASPGVLETIETDNAERETVLDHIFTQTHVVDFATRAIHGVSQQLKLPPTEMATDTGSTLSTQVPGSFKMSSARDGSYVSVSEPSAPSENSSSEGLFISKPRARSVDAEEKRTYDGPGDVSEGANEESTDGGMELEADDQERANAQDESMNVEDVDQDGTSEANDDDASLPDADDLSFTSQVEMVEEFAKSEDEYMSADDAPPEAAVAVEAVWSTVEVEEVGSSDEDVDMIDAGPAPPESASPEEMTLQSPQLEKAGEMPHVASNIVTTEVVSNVTVAAVADESLPGFQAPAQQEAATSSFVANDQDLAVAGLLQGMLQDMPDGQPGTPGTNAEGHELLTVQAGTSSPASFEPKLDAGSSPHGTQKQAEEPSTQSPMEDVVAPPGESQHEPDDNVDMVPETQEDDIIPDASIPPQSPTTVMLDGVASEDQPGVPSSEAEQSEQEKAVDEAEVAAQQAAHEPEMAQPPTSPAAESPAAEDVEDETLILEQLTQEQQQYPETEAQLRTRSPSPDLSVHLARQAVAAKRQKKAPEPARTSPRITRARSSSLRSNATNGTPEKEADSSVSLARAALASPSKRGGGTEAESFSSTTTTTTSPTTAAALKSELIKRLRTDLPECVPLKSLRIHVDKFPNVLAVVTTQPTPPTRAKGGPREYFMSFHVTDPSAAPTAVVEVQLYRPHKDSLPVVAPGDVVLLQRFQVKALSKKGFGLRTGAESAWAVWEADVPPAAAASQNGGGGGDGGGQMVAAAPQIRGPPVEDWEGYVGYVGRLREWFGLVMKDGVAKGKLERADRKLVEAGGGGGGGGK
ncbi:hypothetical protein C8A00DRAFT_16830 [Chaetomidium leptoderma]|uniref:Telomeric single stranded DNA binding POT1/Cdc13 domain-containing protein n=1 Tax=Chaetomidium leptoderma TaxID=669021 RepID=A0AAN6VHT5_9PEZI|nr:hypothetical protein C8A00DRAFT_16830 [Chaetomidium leptoderma]